MASHHSKDRHYRRLANRSEYEKFKRMRLAREANFVRIFDESWHEEGKEILVNPFIRQKPGDSGVLFVGVAEFGEVGVGIVLPETIEKPGTDGQSEQLLRRWVTKWKAEHRNPY